MTEVVAALIWDNDKFMICQRPAHKARGLLWEFVGGKVEPGETKEQALIRECEEELAVTLSVGEVFMDVVHTYPDITVHLTLFHATIAQGEPKKLEHNDIRWISPMQIPDYPFCPADTQILERICKLYGGESKVAFRPLVRKNKALSREACLELLTREPRGILSVNGDGGYPYGMPMNHYYNPEDGCIYFHCGRKGHRLDSLCRSDKVSFCVYEPGYREPGDWAFHIRSVIVFGRMEVIDQLDTVCRMAELLSLKFTQDQAYIQNEIQQFAKATLLLKLIPEHICGKQVIES